MPQSQFPSLLIAVAFGLAVAISMASLSLLGETDDTVSAQQQGTGQDLTLHSDNGAPRGIWSDGSTMWVADFSDRKLYAYALADGSRLDDKDIALVSSNSTPLGLWSDTTTMWVLNTGDDRIYGYSLADGSRDASRDIRLDVENDAPAGIWSDGTTMYVVDQIQKQLFAYSLSDGARQSDKDIAIAFDRPRPVGVWSDKSTFWISYDDHRDYSDASDRRLYAFGLENGVREEDLDVAISTDQYSQFSGIWSDGTTIWVTDTFYDKILAYQLPQPTPSSDAALKELHLSTGTLSPDFAATTTSYTASVSYAMTQVTVHATSSDSSATVALLNDDDMELPDIDSMLAGHQVRLGVNENVIKIQVSAQDEATVQTYLITVTRERPHVSINSQREEINEGGTADLLVFREIAILEQLDVELAVSETGSLVPSSEEGGRTVAIPSGATSTTLSIATDADDDEWEVHSTVTVAIDQDDGYRLTNTASSTSVLVLDNDFPAATTTLSVSPNPVSEGATTTAFITVTTHADRQPHGIGGPLTLSANADTAQAGDFGIPNQTTLQVSPGDFSTTTVDGAKRYRAHFEATITTVEDSLVEVGEAFEIELTKATSSKDSLSLSLAQPTTVSVSILDNDAALRSLKLSGITLSPEFASHSHKYEAQASYAQHETSVAAVAGHADSKEPTVLLGGVADSDGTVPLEVGDNEIAVKVVAEDATSTATYVINVMRAKPGVSISAVETEVAEGDVIEFLISRNTAVSEPLDVGVEITESGSLVPAASLGSRTVTIPSGATTSTTTVSTHANDYLWEPHSTVTATVNTADAFEIQPGAGTASTLVKDNDFPEATAMIDVVPNPVSEGATVSATLTVTTKREEEPHGPGGTLTLDASEDTAQASDYGRFGRTSFSVEPDHFELADVNGSPKYQANYTAAVAITDDADSELDESFHIVVTKADAPRIELPATATTTVVIAANDSSTDPTLSQLTMNPGSLSPTFSSTTTRYSADLGYGIEQVTISPVVNSDNSDVEFLDGSNNDLPDAGPSDDGHQIDLEVGKTTVKVRVTAEDYVTTMTYTVVLVRQKPEVSILSRNPEVIEGTSLVFVITRNAEVSEGLKVRVEVSETETMVGSIEEGSRTVAIPANSTSTTFTVSTEHDDEEWEPHSTVTATISASSTYSIKQEAARAEARVNDNDFPEASAALTISPSEVSEGAVPKLSITVTTTHDQEPHGHGGTLTLSPVGGTAMDEDYRSLSQSTFSVTDSDFSRVDIGSGSMAYRALYTATAETIDDSESEPDETIVFQLGKGPNSEKIKIEGPSTTTVTILANDASSDATLSGIRLSDGTLSPPFSATSTSYTASVPYGVEHVSLEYSQRDSGSEITILDADNNMLDDTNVAPGFQLNLAVGSNATKLKVTAEDGGAMQTYVLTITRAKPTVGILEATSSVSEGGVIAFHVIRSAPVTEALDVLVDVVEKNMLLAAGEAGQSTITIPSHATSTSFTITADTDDDDWEEHSTVATRIIATSTYDIAGGLGLASVQIEDDDFPEAMAELELTPNPISEGEHLTANVVVTTKADQQPHGDGGTLILSLTGETANLDDFDLPHKVEFDIAATDFVAVDVNGAERYRATYSASTTISDDEDAEPSETFTVAISKRAAAGILLPTPSTTTVTIAASDLSADASLASLTVSEGTLSPAFASSTTDYTVRVDYGVEGVDIVPVASDGGATISIGSNKVSSGQGHAADLSVGTSTIEVVVTAQDSLTMRTYSVIIIRSRPTVSILPESTEIIEGATVNFIVSRSAAASEPLELQVDIGESGDLVPDDAEGSKSVTISPEATSTLLTVATDTDDETWEEHSGVTATLAASDDYLVKPGEGSAEVAVRDNDFPEATASLSVSPNPVAEGETVTVTAVVGTKANHQPHRDGGTLMLAIGAGTAQSNDYGSLSQSIYLVNEADFIFDPSSSTYVSEYQATIDITEDSEVETGENFEVSLTLSTTSPPILSLGPSDSVSVGIRDFSVGLVELALSGVNLFPQFSSDTLNYTGTVPYPVVQTVVSATTTEASSQTPRISLEGVPATDGRVPLSNGDNLVTIEVMSEDSSDTRTYEITVTRKKPEVSVAASTRQATEGDVLGYTVARSPSAPDTLAVLVDVVEDGEMVPAGNLGEGSRSVIIPAGATSTSFAVETEEDDQVWDAHSSVTVSVVASDQYVINGGGAVAETLILDDDFPESVASMSVVPTSVIEGGSVTINVDVSTVRDEEPHAGGGPLIVTTANDSAFGDVDYVDLTLSDGTLDFLESDFVQVDESSQTRYRASKLIDIETLDDDVQEGVEKFVVLLDLVTVGPATTSSQIVLDASSKIDVSIQDGPDAELSALALSEAALDPPFSTSTRSYAAEVSYGVELVTLTATTSRDGTSITYHDSSDAEIADQDESTEGHQVPIEVGDNIIKVKVSEADNTVLDSYTVTVTRVEPVVGIATTTSSVLEGDPVVFKVHRDLASSDSLLVELSVTETGEMVVHASQGVGNRSVTIPGNATSTNLTVLTDPDDDLWEEHSTVSASIASHDTYAVSADSGRAEIQVTDDDFPTATATLAVAPNLVEEGRPVFAIVTITTGLDQLPHRAAGAIRLDLVGVSATSGDDFTPPLNDQIAFSVDDFKTFGVGGKTQYSASKEISISTVDDDEYEGPETFMIEIQAVTGGSYSTAPQIAFDPYESLREVTISDNDDAQTGGGDGNGDEPPDEGGSQTSVSAGSGNRSGGGSSSRATFNRDPSFLEGRETSRTVEENSQIGTRVGAQVRAIDRDNNKLTYTLRGEDRSSFTINESTGRLYTAIHLDRETDSRYNLTVAVSDLKGGTDSIEVTIVVTDVDEPPTVTGEQEVTSPEQTSGVVATYEANDPENGDVHWTLSGVDAATFDIDAGALTFLSPPDFEMPTDANRNNSYELGVSASDGVQTSTLDVVVVVVDLDESPSPTPTPTPTPFPEPTPTPTITPTMTPIVMLTSTPSAVPTLTPGPLPTATPSTAPVSELKPTPTPTGTATPVPTPTLTPLPTPFLMNSESPTFTTLIAPMSTSIPARVELQLEVAASTPVPISTPSLSVASPTPSATPAARSIITDGGVVPAWLLLTIVFWAILATGVGVFVYLRYR